MPGPGYRRTAILKGFTPVRIRTSHAAHEHSERRFTRLQAFAFSTDDAPQMLSSGPRFSGWSVALVKSTGHRIALGDDDKVSLLFPYHGSIHVRRRNGEGEARPDELLIVAPGQRTTTLSTGYLGILIQIPIDAFDAMQADAGIPGLRGVERLPKGHPASLAAHEAVRTLERDQPRMDHQDGWQGLVRPIIQAAACQDTLIGDGEMPRVLQHVRAAEAFMLANLDRKLTAEVVARACGVGARALQSAFAHFRRRSPMETLTAMRLEQASRLLKAAGPSRGVTDIALECGFTHLGRFSASYRDMLGERPSKTARLVPGPA